MSKEGDAIKLLLAGLKRQVDGLEERQLKWTRVADGAAYRVMELEKKLAENETAERERTESEQAGGNLYVKEEVDAEDIAEVVAR